MTVAVSHSTTAIFCETTALRFEVERETPFIVQNVARVSAAGRPRPFMNHAVHGAAAQELIVLLIDQHTDGEFVDGRDLDRGCGDQFDAAEPGGCGAGEGC